LLGNFNTKAGSENILKLTARNEISQELNDDNGVRVVNSA
jgi:hypothetical protein